MKIEVLFDVPIHIEKGLKTGEFIRRGGVIVKSQDNKIVMWLKDGKILSEGKVIGNIGKFANIAESAINILTVVLLNEKLNKIQDELKEINEKIDISFKAEIYTANQLLQSAELLQFEDIRLLQLSQARERYYKSISIYAQLVKKHSDLAEKARLKFFTKWELFPSLGSYWVNFPVTAVASYIKTGIDEKEIKNIYVNIAKAIEYLKIVVLCYISIAKTYYLQGETHAAIGAINACIEMINDILSPWENSVDEKTIELIKNKLFKVNIDPLPLIAAIRNKQLNPSKNISKDLLTLIENVRKKTISANIDRCMLLNYKEEIKSIEYKVKEADV